MDVRETATIIVAVSERNNRSLWIAPYSLWASLYKNGQNTGGTGGRLSASDMIPAGTHCARDRRDQGRDLAIENDCYRELFQPHRLPPAAGDPGRADALEMRLRAERRVGEMMEAQPKPPPGRKPDIGLSKNPISERNVERPIELAEAGPLRPPTVRSGIDLGGLIICCSRRLRI
jgi:hypothetical protein